MLIRRSSFATHMVGANVVLVFSEREHPGSLAQKTTPTSEPTIMAKDPAGTTRSEEDSKARFRASLHDRLDVRPGAKQPAIRLDLRHRAYGHRGYETLRDPKHPEWPKSGRFTSDREEAKRWIDEAYGAWLYDQVHGVAPEPASPSSAPPGGQEVAAAADAYVVHLRATKGPRHNTTKLRTTHVEVHIKPALGAMPMTAEALGRRVVRNFLHALTVTYGKYGPRNSGPASRAQKDAVKDTLSAIWKHHNDDVAPPWSGLRLDDGAEKQARVQAVRAGEVGVGHVVKAYTYDQLLHILVAAMWYDQQAIISRPNVQCSVVPNSAGAVACLTAAAMRIAELAYWRWKHIFERALWIPGTKTESAPRWAPYQHALSPWIRWLHEQRLERGAALDPESFVIHSAWRQPRDDEGRWVPTGHSTYIRRLGIILRLAGLKIPQKATHIFRATHITHGESRSDLVTHERLQQYVGHADAFGGVTDSYVDKRPPFMPDSHRQYIKLPTPEEVRAVVPTFKPAMSIERARERAARDLLIGCT